MLQRELQPPGGEADALPPIGTMIDFVLERFHRPLRVDLARVLVLAGRFETANRHDPRHPHGLFEHLTEMAEILDDHLTKEERLLFPLMLAGSGRAGPMPIRVLFAEHEDHAEALRRTRALTCDLTPPEGASPEWRELYRQLRALETSLREHMRFEDENLFPRALCA